MSNHRQLYTVWGKRFALAFSRWPVRYWRRGWWQKIVSCAVVSITLCILGMYGVALWYQHTQKHKPLVQGVSFIADYATYLGTDPHASLTAILNDLHVKHLRLVSYWSDIEPTKGSYDFSELDWEMQQAQAHGAKVTLAIGLRQPRWPECHPPTWVDMTKPENTWEPELEAYMTTVINRYKNSPVLESYQLENEYYLSAFGECDNYSRTRLSSELALVKRLDPHHPVLMSRSNNYAGFSLRKPLPDIIGISVYRHVWSAPIRRYFTYPFPSWYYAFLAGAEQILTGKPSVIHEMQAETWAPGTEDVLQTPLAEQDKTFDATKFQATATFAQQTGIRQIDYWGAEYWYYRLTVLHDSSVWSEAKQVFKS